MKMPLNAKTLHKLGDGKHPDGNGLYLQVKGNRRSWIFRFKCVSACNFDPLTG